MKIIDCFTFYNELKLLKFRFEYLYDTVDWFVLVEATKTYAGNPKPLFYRDNKEMFSKYRDKIIHIVVDDMPSGDWTRENFQRDCIDRGVKTLKLEAEDIVIISDLDEIPNRHTIKNTSIPDGVNSLVQTFYWYNLNTRVDTSCPTAKIVNYKTYCEMTPDSIRKGHCHVNYIPNGGWHFSYFGDVDFIQNKIKQFAHQEYNKPPYNTIEFIERHMREGSDMHADSHYNWHFHHVEINPAELPENYEMLL